jgi:hypothetical protein
MFADNLELIVLVMVMFVFLFFDSQHDWLAGPLTQFPNLTGVIPEKILLIFWDPSLNQNIIRIL